MKDHEKKTDNVACKKTTIGGQALIEGLLMIGPDKKAMAVRKPDGEIIIEEMAINQWSGLANVPFFRGSVRLFRQLVTGTKALLKSAEYAEEIEETEEAAPAAINDAQTSEDFAKTLLEASIEDTHKESLPPAQGAGAAAQKGQTKKKSKLDTFFEQHSELMLYVSAALGLLFSIVLFILLPGFLTDLLRDYVFKQEAAARSMAFLLTLIEGLIRIGLFIIYLAITSKLEDIKRVWMYHGAEHKTIACYEAGEELIVENVRKHSRFHPRCGTAFMFTVLIVSIFIFAFLGWHNRWLNMLIRFLLVPLIAGIAYEIIRWTGRFNNKLTQAVAAPGLWMQRLTTAEPEDSMLEVAIVAMQAVMPAEKNADDW